nr:T9SS type A sorting domain-containing protein [Ignavibacteriaceae bacterium]
LPVELVSFSGALRNNAIQLNWQTATEVDNHGFEIEKKSTKSDWLKIGFVEGHGTSNSPKYYSFTDKSVLSGEKYQYRLKQIDGDGTFTYSNIIEIEASAITGFTLEQNYPNPFSAGSLSGNTETVIRFALPVAGDVRLDVYNSAGERIKTLVEGFREAGVYSVRYSAEGLASGIYFYNLEAGGSRLTGKMLLLR